MKEPLYPVEITPEVLKELKDEELYFCIGKYDEMDSHSGNYIKEYHKKVKLIYLPLSSTPLKQLSDEEIKAKFEKIWCGLSPEYTSLASEDDALSWYYDGIKDSVVKSDHINPIELQKAKDYDKLYKKIQSVYEKKTGDICDIGEIAATHFGFLV